MSFNYCVCRYQHFDNLRRCPNSKVSSKSDRAAYYLNEWVPIYLKNAKERLQQQLDGFNLTYEDVYTFQQVRNDMSTSPSGN